MLAFTTGIQGYKDHDQYALSNKNKSESICFQTAHFIGCRVIIWNVSSNHCRCSSTLPKSRKPGMTSMRQIGWWDWSLWTTQMFQTPIRSSCHQVGPLRCYLEVEECSLRLHRPNILEILNLRMLFKGIMPYWLIDCYHECLIVVWKLTNYEVFTKTTFSERYFPLKWSHIWEHCIFYQINRQSVYMLQTVFHTFFSWIAQQITHKSSLVYYVMHMVE